MKKKKLSAEQKKAYDSLNIDHKNRVILSLDGGGVRGILTIQLLKQLEEVAGIPCYRFCDMVAGTSTGGIIASLIAYGKTAQEIENLYVQFVTKVFLKRSIIAHRLLNPPAYDKKLYRETLKAIFDDITLAAVTKRTGVDIFITAKDVTDNEETFFTSFDNNGLKGTYKDALLRTVVEATMSAPTYFHPLERFIDGGTTTYNNPSLAAFMEAICYDGKGKYEANDITMFSFGTGKLVKSVEPKEAYDPKSLDAFFWLNYVMDESSQDASSMQSDIFRSGLLQLNYRRFQISLDEAAIRKLPDVNISDLHITNADWLREVSDDELQKIEMDDVSRFGLLKAIGKAMAGYIMRHNKFSTDLNNDPDNPRSQRDELVTAFGNISRIHDQVTSPTWIDQEVTT